MTQVMQLLCYCSDRAEDCVAHYSDNLWIGTWEVVAAAAHDTRQQLRNDVRWRIHTEYRI